jgi:hypothetical protein
VLARIEGAPPGVKGISLFIVPKFLVNADGSLGARNDVHCISIEHKLGIHASPTAVLAYGQSEGAVGYLVGEPNRGLEYMFIMMNAARLSVGLEGYAVAERAYQQAAEWGRTRIQGKPPVASPDGKPMPIAHHPDVKRMLLTMRSQVEAMRALGLYAALQLDLGAAHPDAALRAAAKARGELLIPIVKGWSTETGVELASLGIQVHGGMGFIEETGAAQVLRDARITTIYEGTTAIQSNDLIGRKLARDRGVTMTALLAEVETELKALPAGAAAREATLEALGAMRDATQSLLAAMASDPARGAAVSVPYLKLCGLVLGGWLMARAAGIAATDLAAGSADRDFMQAKIATTRFYGSHILPQALALARVVTGGAASVLDTDAALL